MRRDRNSMKFASYKDILEIENEIKRKARRSLLIPEGSTNGDAIKIMFPNSMITIHQVSNRIEQAYVEVKIDGCPISQNYSLAWWNEEYNIN